MPAPLNKDGGESRIVPVKATEQERDALRKVLRDGETVSSVTRDAWRRLVARRLKEK